MINNTPRDNHTHRQSSWCWWQRLAPHGSGWSGEYRASLRAHAYYPWWQRLAHVFVPHERNGYKPHAVRHRALISYGIILIALKAGLSVGLFLTFPTHAHFATLTAMRIVELTNEERVAANVPPLILNNRLEQSAGMKADEMARMGYFAHTSPHGESPWVWFQRAEYLYTYAGENLAMDFNDAETVVDTWMKSPKHRENILNPKYREIGIAVMTGTVHGNTVTLVVQHFGASPTSPSLPIFAKGGAVFGATKGEAPQVAAASTESRVSAGMRSGWWGTALSLIPWVIGVFALLLIVQLLLAMFIHMQLPHRGVVYATVLVIAIAVGMLNIHLHFLETAGSIPIVF